MTVPSQVTSAPVHLADPAFRSDPYVLYRELRERAPVTRLSARGPWAVTGYAENRSFLRDPRLGAEEPPPLPGGPTDAHRYLRVREETRQLFSLFMLYRPTADHARLRRLIQPAFSPSRVIARRARIQDFTDEVLDRAVARGRLDVVNELGRPVALAIAMDLAGIPEAMRPEVAGQASELFHRLATRPAVRERGLLALTALAPRLRELIAEWQVRPPDDDNLLWSLEQARTQGALSEDEVIAHGVLLLLSGHLTTQHLTGNGVLALLRHPDQWDLLRARPQLIETAVDELIRYDSPGTMMQRTALDEIEAGDETIRRGDRVFLLLGAANRDPAVFADPDRLDITRSPNPHIGFGGGVHACPGAGLARLEAEVVIGSLVRRLPPPRLETEALEWEEASQVRGLVSLPILFG
jgi:cytochrome P450